MLTVVESLSAPTAFRKLWKVAMERWSESGKLFDYLDGIEEDEDRVWYTLLLAVLQQTEHDVCLKKKTEQNRTP